MSRAHENAERYGEIFELSAVLEKGERGPDDATEKRASSLLCGYTLPGAPACDPAAGAPVVLPSA